MPSEGKGCSPQAGFTAHAGTLASPGISQSSPLPSVTLPPHATWPCPLTSRPWGFLHRTHDEHHHSAMTDSPLTTYCTTPLGFGSAANAQLHIYRGPARGWPGNKPGFAPTHGMLEAALCSADGGFCGTGERWPFQQPTQPCQLALCNRAQEHCGTLLKQHWG